MKSILDLFSLTKNRKSIPKAWCGLWADRNGKQVLIESTKHHFYAVTVLDSGGEPFKIQLPGDTPKNTIGLTGSFGRDASGNPTLQVEAGINDLGPTYNLYFLVAESGQKLRLARNSDDLRHIIIKPNVGMGLYDDWEDDLGVPWAFPLEDFKKAKNEKPQQALNDHK
tara:strand:+ start:1510 stop:2013 length:504 start_codon:yes stop_codon:yes gene_type:complete